MKNGKTPNSGDVILVTIPFPNGTGKKKRPALILYEKYDNYVIAGITSNTGMNGVPIFKKEGAFKDSVIKLNYIFTVSIDIIEKYLYSLSSEKKQKVYFTMIKYLENLMNNKS